jgi:DNA polymerase III subunit delta
MMADQQPASLAYFYGQDAYAIEHAARDLAHALSSASGQPIETWRTSTDDEDALGSAANGSGSEGAARRRTRLLDEVAQRIATAPMFGGGTLVVIRQPGAVLRESGARQRLVDLLPNVAPGNALCFVDLLPTGGKAPAHTTLLRDAVTGAGGVAREYPALTRDRMEAFITSRAAELGTTLGPGGARLLAERVGAHVRESDIDRRRQSELANAEIEKLALLRPGGTVTREDVATLVDEAVPASAWALQDAVGARRAGRAAALADSLVNQGTPLPVLIAQLHRRLRELIIVRDHLESGAKPPELTRTLRMQPFRVQKLAEQARTWQAAELDAALGALLELDMLSKGIAPDGSPHSLSDERSRLALLAWIGQRVQRSG